MIILKILPYFILPDRSRRPHLLNIIATLGNFVRNSLSRSKVPNDAIDDVFGSEFSLSTRGSMCGKEADHDEMKPDSEYARGRRTGKMVTRDCDKHWAEETGASRTRPF